MSLESKHADLKVISARLFPVTFRFEEPHEFAIESAAMCAELQPCDPSRQLLCALLTSFIFDDDDGSSIYHVPYYGFYDRPEEEKQICAVLDRYFASYRIRWQLSESVHVDWLNQATGATREISDTRHVLIPASAGDTPILLPPSE